MAITLAQSFAIAESTTDQSTYTSGTYTPTNTGAVVYIVIHHTQAAGGIGDATSITSNALANITKVVTQGFNSSASPIQKVELWVATTTATAATIAVNLPGTPTTCYAQLAEMTGVFPSQGPYKGIVQVATAFADGAGAAVWNVPMLQRPNPGNAMMAVFGSGAQTTHTPKTGWTELRDAALATPSSAIEWEWIASPDPNPSTTPNSTNVFGGIAFEIAAAPVRAVAIQETLLQPATPALLPTERLIRPAVVATTGSTGTLATTNTNDTLAASGTTTVTGSLARTNANDTSNAAGTTTVLGTLAKTNANDTLSAAGSVGSPVSGTLATTNTNDTSVAAGTTKILGTSATTNANDTLTASGVVTTPVTTTTPQQVGGTLSGRRGPYTAVDAELEAILRDDEEILCLI